MVENARSVVTPDRRRSRDVIAKCVGVSHWTAFNIVNQDLHMNKVSARWVSRFLAHEVSVFSAAFLPSNATTSTSDMRRGM